MNKILYNTGNGPSEIYFNLSLDQVKDKIKPEETVIITDSNILKLYGSRFPKCPVIEIAPGEKEKNLVTIESIIEKLLFFEIDRSHFLLGIGGGVICDITGFAASIYMRGVKFGFISTSLLSQIDASTGGKNGVNVGGFKNVAGCFSQPAFVLCDPKLLITLSDEEYLSGLGELVKYALIKDKYLFEFLDKNIQAIKKRDAGIMAEIIQSCVKIKIAVVEKDEKETGERRLLNFGHTVGHAIELHTGAKHGMAVARGIQIAANLSVAEGLLSVSEYQRIINLLENLGLRDKKFEINDSIIELIRRDKKREKKLIHFVFLNRIGNGIIKTISLEELINRLKIMKNDC